MKKFIVKTLPIYADTPLERDNQISTYVNHIYEQKQGKIEHIMYYDENHITVIWSTESSID